MPLFETYHGADSQHHQERFNALAPKGWRMISLSVHGNPQSPRYSVVWVKEPSPSFIAVHDLPISQYQQWFVDQTKKGFAPVLVTATGGGENAVVAAVFEQGVKNGWLAKHGLESGSDADQNTIEFWCNQARNSGLVLRSGSIYGSSSQRLYIAVWHPMAESHWNWRTGEAANDHHSWFNTFQEVPLRPAFVTLSDHQVYFSAFRDDSVGEWHARHNRTGGRYQTDFEEFRDKGFFPICVQGGGEGAKTRYAAIFAKRHTPLPRVWNVRGSGLAKFDALVKEFMQANGVRAGQLSIAKIGAFKVQRAYTWADEGYPVTEVSHPMRIASLSKMFTCACIQRLYDQRLVSENTKVFARLGITKKAVTTQTVDSRINDITVEHLVDHEGGWDRATSTDYVIRMREVANALGLSRPVTKFDVVRYAYGEPLQFKPGSKSQYANIGYITLAFLIERITGTTYTNYLRRAILRPDGITDVWLARTLQSQRLPNEVFYDDPNVDWSAAEPGKEKRTGYCHGGEGWVTEAMDGSGGLCATASAVVQFLRRHAVGGRGGRVVGGRTGSMAGVSSRAESRPGGVDYAFIFNTRHLPKMPVNDFTDKLNSLLAATRL